MCGGRICRWYAFINVDLRLLLLTKQIRGMVFRHKNWRRPSRKVRTCSLPFFSIFFHQFTSRGFFFFALPFISSWINRGRWAIFGQKWFSCHSWWLAHMQNIIFALQLLVSHTSSKNVWLWFAYKILLFSSFCVDSSWEL